MSLPVAEIEPTPELGQMTFGDLCAYLAEHIYNPVGSKMTTFVMAGITSSAQTILTQLGVPTEWARLAHAVQSPENPTHVLIAGLDEIFGYPKMDDPIVIPPPTLWF